LVSFFFLRQEKIDKLLNFEMTAKLFHRCFESGNTA
jgi:hypothetical protein